MMKRPPQHPDQTAPQPGAGPAFGKAIRKRRKALGKTLEAVAQETQLTIGFLSQVERGVSSPSLSSFMRIAAALQTTMEELLSLPEPFSVFSPREGRSTYRLGEAGKLYEKLGPGFQGALNYPSIIHRVPGHVSERMSHEGEAFLYLLEGQLEYHLGDQVFLMGPGDSIHHDTRTLHYSRVLGDRDSVELWVSSRPRRTSPVLRSVAAGGDSDG
ncbi:cupin domain-containing protein [Microvirga tunisiensis]|uniref:Cupin domain-containing protein n=2 Tax=Pannonibacter tanglangensis TaxID=2750084 RepID=A0A7X5J845_9HYPH|nr:cupin domain-containing protein [Pannonibacter sp. XCT-53]